MARTKEALVEEGIVKVPQENKMIEAILIGGAILAVLAGFLLTGMVLLVALFSAASCCDDEDDSDV